jgi:redox-sensing transcriptional repressor
MRYRKIPDQTVRRPPAYLRGALHLSRTGAPSASGKELADLRGVEPWQIRNDFSCFGDFGAPGVSYDLSRLISGVRVVAIDIANDLARLPYYLPGSRRWQKA